MNHYKTFWAVVSVQYGFTISFGSPKKVRRKKGKGKESERKDRE